MRVGLVACCSQKRSRRCQARFLYTSPLFVLSAKAAQTLDAWAVLSAEHGLVEPDRELDPYERTLNGAAASEVAEWGKKVGAQIEAKWPGARFVVFAGERYQSALAGKDWVDALRGLPIGKRLKALKEGAWTR